MLTPSRLKLARQRRGMTRADLGRRTGITTRSLLAYEVGEQAPTAEYLRKLSDALAFPIAFFEGAPVEEVPTAAISFRALSKLSAGQRDAARGAGQLALIIADWIGERFHLPAPDVPALTGMDPETAAETVRRQWGLGVTMIGNMVHVLEAHGIRVFSVAADCRDVDAYSFYRGPTPYVFLNTVKTPERTRFDCAHELGHLVLHHQGEQVAQGPEAERGADRFAAAMLMPRSSVLAAGLRNATVDQILAARRRWKVSAMALTHRLHELHLLTEWGYRTACIDLSRLGYRRGEPGGTEPEASQLLHKVQAALREEGTTPTRFADSLGITVEELNKHFFGLVPVSLKGGGQQTGQSRPNLTVIS